MENAEFNAVRNNYVEEIWDFYQVYNLICAINGVASNRAVKNKMFRELVSKSDYELLLIEMRKMMDIDRKIVFNYFSSLSDEEKAMDVRKIGDDVVAVQDY